MPYDLNKEGKVSKRDGSLRMALVLSVIGLVSIGFRNFTRDATVSPEGHTSPSVPKPLPFENATPYAGQVNSLHWLMLKDWYYYPLRTDGTDLTFLRPRIWDALSDGSLLTPELEDIFAVKKLEIESGRASQDNKK